MAIELKDIGYIIGSLSGVVSIIILIWTRIYGWFKRPTLKISFDKNEDLRVYSFVDTGWQRKFFTLHIRNSGKYTAKRCVGVVNVITSPTNVGHVEHGYPLHWSDIDYSARATGAQPVDIGSEGRRLDVVFTNRDSPEGGWLAVPIALSVPKRAREFYIPPGEYELKVTISCENGRGDTKKFKVASPQQWADLNAVEIG